ncbi:DNA topoisomerase 2 [Mortierella alpina]|nr:DNA topoisomerase 2 [Mortierella alpina]
MSTRALHHIQSHMWIFVNYLIENPAFDSQTKENMTLKQSAFGSNHELGEKFVMDIVKSPTVDDAVNWAAYNNTQALVKTDGSSNRQHLTDVPKMKMPTWPDEEVDTIVNIQQNLGLTQGKVYTSIDELRYGHLMLVTDQDHDGSYLKDFIINSLDHYIPSLLQIPGFLLEFFAPIIKAAIGRETRPIFTIPEYVARKEEVGGAQGWKIEHYKGLGTSYKEDVKDFFRELELHKKEFARPRKRRAI